MESNEATQSNSESVPEKEEFGGGGRGAPPNERETEKQGAPEKQQWWPSCFHKRWTKLDKTKFKDRIVWLKECRACGKKKTEVVYRDLNSRQVYTGRDVFAVEYKGGERFKEA